MCYIGGEMGNAYLLELLDGTLVDTTALVDQVTGGGRLAGIDVADNDDVDVSLLLLTARLSALFAGPAKISSDCARNGDGWRRTVERCWKLTYPMVTVLKWLLWKVEERVSVDRKTVLDVVEAAMGESVLEEKGKYEQIARQDCFESRYSDEESKEEEGTSWKGGVRNLSGLRAAICWWGSKNSRVEGGR